MKATRGAKNCLYPMIVETYCEANCLTNGVVDFAKVQPILFIMNDISYWQLGAKFARAWQVGESLEIR